jgi:hypothetical protein
MTNRYNLLEKRADRKAGIKAFVRGGYVEVAIEAMEKSASQVRRPGEIHPIFPFAH